MISAAQAAFVGVAQNDKRPPATVPWCSWITVQPRYLL